MVAARAGRGARATRRGEILLMALATCAGFAGFWAPSRALALDPGRDITQFNCQTWSRQNGLPVNGINAITQTRDGYLWLGTSAGLVRFDGIEFKLHDLAGVDRVRNGRVTSLANSRKGGLWVGLEHSAFGSYDGQVFSFLGKETWGKEDMNVRSILESKDGTLWLAAERQASRLTSSGLYEEVLGRSSDMIINILCGYEDSTGRLWFGTASDGVHYWQDGKISKLTDPVLDATLIHCLVEGANGEIWIGTSRGLHCYDANLERKEIPPYYGAVLALLTDRHGVLWFGTSGLGLARYQNGRYEFLRKTDGLASDYVQSLAQDREGSLWAGTRDGVSQLTDIKFPTEKAASDASVTEAWAVGASRRGGVWVGSDGGLTYFDGTATTYSTEAGLPDTFVKRVFEAANGDVYAVSGDSDLVIFSAGKVVATHSASNLVVGMAEDEHGVIVSVGGSLYRAGTNYFTPYAFTNDNAPAFHWILNLTSGRDNAIWVASVNGIFRVKDGAFQHWSTAEGLSDTRVLWLTEDDDGVVWGALLAGIARLKDNQIHCISRKHGLFDDNIYAIIPDDHGDLWVDSGRGIFRVSRKSMNDFADGRTAQVESIAYDGPESVKTTDKTAHQEHVGCKTMDGRIWFPSPHGVVVVNPASIPTNGIAPPVYVDRIRANGKEIPKDRNAVVPPGSGELEFHVAALTFIAPQKVHFQYQLEGYDDDWVDAGNRRMAFYTNLKPGRYTFRVIAANADGIWNTTGDSFTVELLPWFYQTAWFYFLCGGVAVAGLSGIYGWRVKHLKRKQTALQNARDQLEKEVQNRTAELARANASLRNEEHQLKLRTQSLEQEIEQRARMQKEIERIHRELLLTSRLAGMAEVATGVLHNVGNVLNSVNVSTTLLHDRLMRSKVHNVGRAAALMQAHTADLGGFMTRDPKGIQLPGYLDKLAENLATEQKVALEELAGLQKNVGHIKEIVTMQQSYAKVAGVTETVKVSELVEDALRINESALERHAVRFTRDYDPEAPCISIDRHKVIQILINLIRNAKYACDDSESSDKHLILRIVAENDRVEISVIDNGVGIPSENLTRIFSHGFTTRKNGHGFGLHSGALAAKELGGSLRAYSDGKGKGARFTLDLPLQPPGEIETPSAVAEAESCVTI
jgi:ligand-binding sensor domain-containing protein/signal transduction histidine kinase